MYFVPIHIITCYEITLKNLRKFKFITDKNKGKTLEKTLEHRILLIFYILYFIRVHFNIIKLICEPGSNSYRLGLYIAFTGQTSFLRVLIKPFFVQGSTHTMRKLTETGPSLKEKLILAGQQTQILPSVQRRRRRRRG